MTARNYIKYYLPAMGFIGMLVMIFYQAETEYIVYSVIGEVVIFLLGDPYNVIHFWLSLPARLILISCIVVDTYVIRMRLSIEFVAIPVCITIVALIAVIRYNTDWRAYRAYIESATVREAMALEEESAAALSWIYHGRQECLEIAHRLERYTGKQVFNPADAKIWQDEMLRIESHQPVRNLKQAITAERIIDFMGMCYKAGYLRSAPYKANYAERNEKISSLQEEIQMLSEEKERIAIELEQEQERAARGWAYAEEQRSLALRSLGESQERFSELEREKERFQELLQYSEGLEEEIDRLRSELLEKKQSEEPLPQIVEQETEVLESPQMPKPKKTVRRMTQRDIQMMRKLKSEGMKYEAIAEKTGFSVRTVNRVFSNNKEDD